MEDVLYYLLKVSAATTVFYFAYYLLLRRNKDFVFNRFYLLGSFLLSFIIPLATFKTSSYLSQANVYFREGIGAEALEPVGDPSLAETPIGWPEILLALYAAGLIYYLVKMLNGCFVAASIGNQTREEMINGMKIYVSDDNIRAFTFLERVVIGKNILDHPSIAIVLDHESVHLREKHSYDILIAELLLVLQWFNPFAKFLVQSIRNNLEFRADDVVVRNSDIQEYMLTMVSMASNRLKPPLFTELNSSNLKKRVLMMKSHNSNRFAGIAKLALIPVLGLLLLSLSEKQTVVVKDKPDHQGEIQKLVTHNVNNVSQDTLRSQDEILRYISYNIKYPQEARKSGHIGVVVLYAAVGQDGTIEEILEGHPAKQFVDIEEVTIIGYQNDEPIAISYGSQETLKAEGQRVIESFPPLGIPDLYGQTLKFKFKFLLR